MLKWKCLHYFVKQEIGLCIDSLWISEFFARDLKKNKVWATQFCKMLIIGKNIFCLMVLVPMFNWTNVDILNWLWILHHRDPYCSIIGC